MSHPGFFFPARFLFHLITVPCLAILSSCAVQEGPKGGPPDSDPPVIVTTYPANYSTHFDDNKIRLEFDEYVDERSVEESIFISPYVGELEFDWSGKEVEITFSDRLRKNTTYVVNIGTDVKDQHERNRMSEAVTLAFSTGDDIDHGAIEGRVLPENPGDETNGIMIFAYSLSIPHPDSLDPRSMKPDYITQTGKGGSFSLRHLAFGPYRLLAVKDEYRNLTYDQEVDAFAIPPCGIDLTPQDTMQSRVFMQLAKEDTTAPRLVKAEAIDARHLIAEFSENMDSTSPFSVRCVVVDTLTRDSLKVVSLFANLPKLFSYTLLTGDQDSTKGYRLVVTAGRDLAGNPVHPNVGSLNFQGSAKAPAVGANILSVSIRDSVTSIDLIPELHVVFSDPTEKESVASSVAIEESAGTTVTSQIRWLTDAAISIRPRNRLRGNAWYKLRIAMREVRDLAGMVSKDSTKSFRFETLDEESMSSIEGIVVDKNKVDTAGIIYVTAKLATRKDPRGFSVAARLNGAFNFPEMPEGRYTLQAFRDRNGNRKYDVGRPFPVSQSERLSSYSDTLKLRARWPLEGVRIELP